MYKERQMTSMNQSSSYSPYTSNIGERPDLYRSYRQQGESNIRYHQMPIGTDIKTHHSNNSYHIPPSSLRSQYQDISSSYIITDPRSDYDSNRNEKRLSQSIYLQEQQPQHKMEDLKEYMNYLFTQIEKSIELNGKLTASYDSINKQANRLREQNIQLQEMVNTLQLQSSKTNMDLNQKQTQEDEKEEKEMAQLLEAKDKIIANLTKQLNILKKQKDNISSTIKNYDQEISDMAKTVEDLSQNATETANEAEMNDPQVVSQGNALINSLTEEISALSQINEDKRKQIAEFKLLLKEKQAEMTKPSNLQMIYKNEQFKEEYDKAKKKNGELQTAADELKNINENLIDSKEKMKKAYTDIIDKMQTAVNSSIDKYQNIEDIIKQNELFKQQNEFFSSKLKSLPDLDEALDNLKKENEKIKQLIQYEGKGVGEEEDKEDNGDNDNDENEDAEQEEQGEGEEEELQEEERNIALNQEENDSKIKSIRESQLNIEHSFSLYNICLNKLIAYDFNKKTFKTITPTNYDAFLKEYQPEGSMHYNTLEGLFILTGQNYTQLFYYSQKKNTISPIMQLKENHCNGSMLMDDSTKSLIFLSGDHTSKVEQFCFDSLKHTYLPPMLQSRSNSSFIFINHKLYGFFGFNYETGKALSTIECLDLDSCSTWEYVNYSSKSNRDYAMSHHLAINADNDEVVILGGIQTNSETVNEKVIMMDMRDNTIKEMEFELPFIKDTKFYMFENNSQSNLLLLNDEMFMVGIDSMNNIHMLDKNLGYEVIVFAKMNKNSGKEK